MLKALTSLIAVAVIGTSFCIFNSFAEAKPILSGEACEFSALTDVRNVSENTTMAVMSIAGLLNRDTPTVYTVSNEDDVDWQQLLLANCSYDKVPALDIMKRYFGNQFDTSGRKNVVMYGWNESSFALSSVVTMCGVLDAVPLDEALYNHLVQITPNGMKNAFIVLDTRGRWSSQEEAVNYTVIHALNKTTSMAFQQSSDVQHGYLVDWIVSQRLFAHYLSDACIPFTENNRILKNLVANAPWQKPIRVYGYNSQDPIFGGDSFEAETNCINTMGQVATQYARNLAFLQNLYPINATAPRGSTTGPFKQPQTTGKTYDPSKKYVALVYGDMDNIDFVQSFGRQHMQYRSEQCENKKCFPLSWTMSPNLLEFSPSMIRWYYEMAAKTGGQDSFMMPPSGTLYAYPGMMPSDVQTEFVEQQNFQANLMDSTSSISWEWFFAWDLDFKTYFPRYIDARSQQEVTSRNFFLNDVPWPIPIPGMWLKGETYVIFGDVSDPSSNVVAFKPAFNWQENGIGGLQLTPEDCAKEIESTCEVGTVQYVYMIQNNPVGKVFQMVGNITDPNIEIVSHADLADLARQKAQRENRGLRHGA